MAFAEGKLPIELVLQIADFSGSSQLCLCSHRLWDALKYRFINQYLTTQTVDMFFGALPTGCTTRSISIAPTGLVNSWKWNHNPGNGQDWTWISVLLKGLRGTLTFVRIDASDAPVDRPEKPDLERALSAALQKLPQLHNLEVKSTMGYGRKLNLCLKQCAALRLLTFHGNPETLTNWELPPTLQQLHLITPADTPTVPPPIMQQIPKLQVKHTAKPTKKANTKTSPSESSSDSDGSAEQG
eukprot:TRINITY_DN18099_c0_g1_i1.p1 TRINITY_DN18099_c0_g1~~TRINITY_DN18099_c0_g1_i1.p1  ORF type:complete len:241 (+),score=16.04 TRINITY_DN18099_c0_g1_i1:35-757(+)